MQSGRLRAFGTTRGLLLRHLSQATMDGSMKKLWGWGGALLSGPLLAALSQDVAMSSLSRLFGRSGGKCWDLGALIASYVESSNPTRKHQALESMAKASKRADGQKVAGAATFPRLIASDDPSL